MELDVTGVYCKVAEGGSPAAELSGKLYHWGTCLYLGLVIAKVSRACILDRSNSSICFPFERTENKVPLIQKGKLHLPFTHCFPSKSFFFFQGEQVRS